MSFVSNTSSSRKRRLIRGIALLFLIYTAMDIASPELCRGETLGDLGQTLVAMGSPQLLDNDSSNGPRIAASDNQPTNESSEQPSGDDDCCFCCCSHVLPGTVIANVAVTDLRSSVTFLEYLSVPSPPLARTFHPPRSA
jgi:hypothetical protein